jgi:hypothetical protein
MATSPYDRRLERQGQEARETFFRNSPLARPDGGITVNAGIAKEAYFISNSGDTSTVFDPILRRSDTNQAGLWKLLRTDASGNAPTNQSNVARLWQGASVGKGMIATTSRTSAAYEDPFSKTPAAKRVKTKYGFQFHYNPQTVQMSYAANPDFDVTMLTSGREAFNLLGPAALQSGVTFNLILNRINDMKYFTMSGNLRPGISERDWAGRFPSSGEQRDIFNKGTMYDLEFLLRAIVGYQQAASLKERNLFDGKTADLGFLTGIPVDLHLGKSLRYLVRVDNITLTHVIFNERMVPLFTEVAIGCTRIPDYGGDTRSSSPSASSSTRSRPAGRSNYTTRYGVVVDDDGFGFDFGLSDPSGYRDILND